MVQGIRRWTSGVLGLALLSACAPHPVYRTGQPANSATRSRPESASSQISRPPAPALSQRAATHPVDPAEISIENAYQVGTASYYGKKFHGRKTANGETFNMYKLTAAHRVLPLGTVIRVTDLRSGRWVEVRVNDRGPFVEGRILDLSFAAALELEMVAAGTAKVMIEVVQGVD